MKITQTAPIDVRNSMMTTEEIITKYTSLVYRVAFEYFKNKYDAEDICQEVFLCYWKKNPIFENENHEKAWFIRVTINHCNNQWKMPWNKRKVTMNEEVMDTMSGTNVSDDFTNAVSNNIAIEQALHKLSGKERVMVYLFYYEEYKVKDIAKLLCISESSAYVRLNRIRQKLKKLLKGDYDYD